MACLLDHLPIATDTVGILHSIIRLQAADVNSKSVIACIGAANLLGSLGTHLGHGFRDRTTNITAKGEYR